MKKYIKLLSIFTFGLDVLSGAEALAVRTGRPEVQRQDNIQSAVQALTHAPQRNKRARDDDSDSTQKRARNADALELLDMSDDPITVLASHMPEADRARFSATCTRLYQLLNTTEIDFGTQTQLTLPVVSGTERLSRAELQQYIAARNPEAIRVTHDTWMLNPLPLALSHNINTLVLHHVRFNGQGSNVQHILALPHLHTLELSDCRIQGQGNCAGLTPPLQRLKFNGTDARFLGDVSRFTQLELLDIEGLINARSLLLPSLLQLIQRHAAQTDCVPYFVILSSLAPFKSLQRLTCEAAVLEHPTHATQLRGLHTLRTLELRDTYALYQEVSEFPQSFWGFFNQSTPRSLEVNLRKMCGVKAPELARLATFGGTIGCLALEGQFHTRDLQRFAQGAGRHLQTLELRNFRLGEGRQSNLLAGLFPNLTTLCVQDEDDGYEDFHPGAQLLSSLVSGLPRLQMLWGSDNDSLYGDDAAISAEASDGRPDDRVALRHALSQATQLRTLYLEYPITRAYLQGLQGHPTLEEVYIRNFHGIDAQTFTALFASMPQLRKVVFITEGETEGITEGIEEELQEMLESLTPLFSEKIDFSICDNNSVSSAELPKPTYHL